MTIRNIRLFNFRNYADEAVEFSSGLNCILGDNGAGKTNLIDAIHYLSFTKSAFNAVDKDHLREGEKQFLIRGEWEREEDKKEVISCSYQQGKGKTFQVDGIAYERISEHIGKFPVVMMAPNDTDIIRDGSEIRRKFADAILCQADVRYMEELIHYNRLLRQRNALLKHFSENHLFDRTQLDIYTDGLIRSGEEIYRKRENFISEFYDQFRQHFQWISREGEVPAIRYRSEAAEGLSGVFEKSLSKDRILERTTAGVHRDDYRFSLDGRSLKKYGSQGQQKSFMIALKMTQFAYLERILERLPVLLLDDIFDKLDKSRLDRLMERIREWKGAQVFITDARPDRTYEILRRLELKAAVYHVDKGKINMQE